MINKFRQLSTEEKIYFILFTLLLVAGVAYFSLKAYVLEPIDFDACATPTQEEIVAGRPDCPPESK